MKRFKRLLYVAVENVDQTSAIERAVTLTENNQAELTVIAVIPPIALSPAMFDGGPDVAELQAEMVREARQCLEALVEPCRNRLNIKLDVFVGTAFLEIIRAILRDGYDLVIKPAENPDFVDRLFGSDDMHLLRKCPCPVWLLKPKESASYRCILAAVDFDPQGAKIEEQYLNQQILDLSASLAISDFAALHLVHAWEAVGEGKVFTWSENPSSAVAAYVEGERLRHEAGFYLLGDWLRKQIGKEAYDYLAPSFHLGKGRASQVISNLVAELDADLVVMGTVARTGISGFIIGNTAETILERVNCSVLALKPAGFVSPVKLED